MIVCATVVRDERVLLVRHSCEQKPDYGDWLLPAGNVEVGQSLEEALKREAKEELGLSIRTVRKLTEHVDPYTGDRLADFLCTPTTSKIELSSEISEARWFTANEIRELANIHAGLKEGLLRRLEYLFH